MINPLTDKRSLEITRNSLRAWIPPISAELEKFHDALIEAHERNYLDTMHFWHAAEHIASVWRSLEYADTALRGK